jgi:dTDP-4-amino-4,6-dideoxygalactose transaminase
MVLPANEIWNYQQIDLGHNYRMTDIGAALGLSQLGRLDKFIKRRHEIAQHYDQLLSSLPISLPQQHSDVWSSYHLYPIRVNKNQCGKTQRQVYDNLLRNGIGINLHYIPIYRQPYYEKMGFSAGYCKEAELLFKEVISIPIYASLTNEKQNQVIDELKKVLA